MNQRLYAAAVVGVVALGLSACSNQANGGGNSASGSVGLTRDDALLYAADADRNSVFVFDTRSNTLVAEIAVGRQPEKVLVGADDTIYVTNRLDRTVSVLRRGEAAEATRLNVGVEPVGLALSTDARTLYVVNATALTDTDFGTLMAFDTATLSMKWETPVGHEPRGIALTDDGHALVTLFKEGDVVTVDLAKGQVLKSGTDVFSQLNATTLGLATPDDRVKGAPRPLDATGFFGGPSTTRPRGLAAILSSADGQQVYTAALLSTDAVLNTNANVTQDPNLAPREGGGGYGGGSCGSTAVASPAILTFNANGEPQVDDTAVCAGFDGSDRPPMLVTSNLFGQPVQGPSAMALDSTGSFLFIANLDSNNVSIVPTVTRGQMSSGSGFEGMPSERSTMGPGTVRQLVAVGAGPTGIAVASDGTTAWVYNAFDHSVSRLERRGGEVTQASVTKLGDDVLPADVVAGRKLFFSAVDARMNNPGTGIACGTCHLEGREDGHVWNFPDGPRQTPSLQGKMLSRTAPFHWNGEFPDLMAFMTHTVTNRMGGSGVTADMERQVAAFLDAMPAPDNALKDSTPAQVLARGRAAFEKAQCQSCHSGETFTDNKFADVGTFVSGKLVNDQVALLPNGGLNTPSLLGIARSAPYLHDGSAATLKARILEGKAGNRHGQTAQLTTAEVDDLVAYLKAL